jgi:predicted oxidoreductase
MKHDQRVLKNKISTFDHADIYGITPNLRFVVKALATRVK